MAREASLGAGVQVRMGGSCACAIVAGLLVATEAVLRGRRGVARANFALTDGLQRAPRANRWRWSTRKWGAATVKVVG